jgi:hypothetical protein
VRLGILTWLTILAGIGSVAVFAMLTMFGLAFARRFRATVDLVDRSLKATERLSQRLDLPFVSGLLPLRFLHQFEQFVQRLDRIAQ